MPVVYEDAYCVRGCTCGIMVSGCMYEYVRVRVGVCHVCARACACVCVWCVHLHVCTQACACATQLKKILLKGIQVTMHVCNCVC